MREEDLPLSAFPIFRSAFPLVPALLSLPVIRQGKSSHRHSAMALQTQTSFSPFVLRNPAMRSSRPATTAQSQRIAVVDDEPVIRSLLERLLKVAGYETVSYASGEAALEACQRESFDLLITDLRMPGIDGFELMENLKFSRPGLPVIILTAHGDVDTAIEALRRRACDFITKPFDTCNILTSVRRVLERNGGPQN